ncbi:MAG: hypothetical protein J5805_01745 [Bacteroidaceae bacterium]|nr:hypothetical protein [Bacteroidaceae bacterium]
MNTEKISKYVFYVLIGISIISFILFFINFDRAWEENPKMYDPQFLDVLLVWNISLLVIGALSAICSFCMYVKQWGFNKSYLYTWGLPILTTGIGAIYGASVKDEHWLINNKDWCKPDEIIVSDACLWSIIILLVIALGSVIFSLINGLKK